MMMKYVTNVLKLTLITLVGFVLLSFTPVVADSTTNTVVYFYSPGCYGCNQLIGGGEYDQFGIHGEYDTSVAGYNPDNDYIKRITDAGITIIYLK